MRQLLTTIFIACICMPAVLKAQDDTHWTLQRAVQYALQHNISIQQNVLNERLARLSLQQSQLSQLPNASVNSQFGRSYGRSVDPTTNQFVEGVSSYDFMSLNGNADILLFGWFQKRNTITGNKLKHEAAKADLDQLKDDVSLNVATGYLRALLAQEQIRVSEKQVELSKAQLEQTKRFAEAGRLPELNVAQLEAQLSGDSANMITAISDYNSAILDIKAILNLDFATGFIIEIPDVSLQDQVALNSMTPEQIYEEASQNLGSIKSSELKLAAARKNIAAAKGSLWPQLGVGAQFGTNWASTYKEPTSINITGARASNYFIPVGDTVVQVYEPTYTYTTRTIPFGTQFENNLRKSIALNLTIPLFQGWQAQYAVKQAQINMFNQRLNKDQAELNLKQNVYKAYNDASNSVQKYYAAARGAESAQRAFDFAQKRYELGLTNTVEYLTTQNTLFSADSRLASAKYDLIFKLKVIDYYLGKELKL
jgi:outer membrane protein